MKKLLTVLLAIMFIIPTGTIAYADTVETGKITDSINYKFNITQKTLYLTGKGELYLKPSEADKAKYEDYKFAYDEDEIEERIYDSLYYNDTFSWRKYQVKTLNIGDGITNIDERFIDSLNPLETIYIGSGYSKNTEGFKCIPTLKEIVVSPKNKTYKSKDGALFSKNMKTLIAYPIGKKIKNSFYYVPSGVEKIEEGAYGRCYIDEVYDGNGELYTYECVKGITNLVLPKSVKEVGKNYIAGVKNVFVFNPDWIIDNYTGDYDGDMIDFCFNGNAIIYANGVKKYSYGDEEAESNYIWPLKKVKSRYYAIEDPKFEYKGKAIKPDLFIFDKNGKLLKAKKDYKIKYSKGRKKVGKYSYTVKFKKGKDKKKKFYFTIVPADVNFIRTDTKGKNLKIKWDKHTKETTGFEIKYTSNGKRWKTIRIKNKKATSKTIRFNKELDDFYGWDYKVRAYKVVKGKKYYSDWSRY